MAVDALPMRSSPTDFAFFTIHCGSQTAREPDELGGLRGAALQPFSLRTRRIKILESTTDVARLLGDSINQLRRGQLDPRVANSVGYLGSVLLRAMEQGPTEQRLANLEAILGAKASSPI